MKKTDFAINVGYDVISVSKIVKFFGVGKLSAGFRLSKNFFPLSKNANLKNFVFDCDVINSFNTFTTE